MKQTKLSFYELNVRYFRDYSGDGIGDLTGLANKLEYFKYLGVEVIILQDVLSVDSLIDDEKAFTKVATEIGDINNLAHVIEIAAKYKIIILIEVPLGSISENHSWFKQIIKHRNSEYDNVVKFYAKKNDRNLKYGFLEKTQQYFIKDSETNEIPLNWSSQDVMDKFMDIIHYWQNIGIKGFVFKNYEFLVDIKRKYPMDILTMKILKKFYQAIKDVNDNLIIVGKSNKIPIKEAKQYTSGITKVFDYFISEKFSENGLHHKFKQDVVGHFSLGQLIDNLNDFAQNGANIISFDSRYLGRVISRWFNDSQYMNQAAKALIMLAHFSPASTSLYYGNEIGMPNIGLSPFDDFQDFTLERRKATLKTMGVSETRFMKAQIMQGAINARALMPWDESKNGGFSTSDKPISPISNRYQEFNVKFQFINKESVLNFTRQIIKLTKHVAYENIFTKGKYSIKRASLFAKVVDITIKYKKEAIILKLNLSSKSALFNKPHNTKFKLANYSHKDYENIPKSLEPFEAILFTRNINELNNDQMLLSHTRETFLAKINSNQARMQKLSKKLQTASETQKEKDYLRKQEQKQQKIAKQVKEKQDIDFAIEREKKIKQMMANEDRLRDQIAREEREKMIEKRKKQELANQKIRLEKESETLIAQNTNIDELEEVKKAARDERKVVRAHQDEKTNLTEDEVAKTVLITDDFDLEDLFEEEKN